jgi:uncharacterized protein YwqG
VVFTDREATDETTGRALEEAEVYFERGDARMQREEVVAQFKRELRRVLSDEVREKRATTLLRPRRSSRPIPFTSSKIGGIPNLNGFETWPVCDACGFPLNFVLQLYRADFPAFYFPEHANLFQLFRCPSCQGKGDDWERYDHKMFHYYHRLDVQRENKALIKPRAEGPDLEPEVFECVFEPKVVDEYDLAPQETLFNREDGFKEKLRGFAEGLGCDLGSLFFDHSEGVYEEFYANGGTKFNGYPNWVQFVNYPACGCGSSPEKGFIFQLGTDSDDTSHGIYIGDVANIYYFVCRECGESTIESRWDRD